MERRRSIYIQGCYELTGISELIDTLGESRREFE